MYFSRLSQRTQKEETSQTTRSEDPFLRVDFFERIECHARKRPSETPELLRRKMDFSQ